MLVSLGMDYFLLQLAKPIKITIEQFGWPNSSHMGWVKSRLRLMALNTMGPQVMGVICRLSVAWGRTLLHFLFATAVGWRAR